MRHAPRRPRAVTLAAPAGLVTVLVTACAGSLELSPSDAATVLSGHHLDHPNPALAGPHDVLTLYYGSGTDRNRPEYRDSVAIVTETVDASRLVSLGASAESRNSYWGFSPDSFPINARVWYPDDPGPHPLVLVVHGNHNMRDFSDPGYDWLGELLASRGHILASVDMNFINGGIRQENDGRGWLLLKHLQAWQRFNEDPDGPFHGRVDMDNIALIGHSRGGEAVALAAAFNRLTRYPDDASLEFDFGFDIRSVISIAPVDGQYLPADQRAPLSDINYLVFHGSHDGDVTSFHGLRLFNRVRFTRGADSGMFKSAVYVYRANHGQWNTVWGAHDNGPRSPRILELRGLLPPEDQREFGRVFVSAFLDITLKGDDRYRPLFRTTAWRAAGCRRPCISRARRFSGRLRGGHRRHHRIGSGRDAPRRRLQHLARRPHGSPLQQPCQHVVVPTQPGTLAGLEQQLPRLRRARASVRFHHCTARRTIAGVGRRGRTTLEMHVGGLDDEPGPRRRGYETEGEGDRATAIALQTMRHGPPRRPRRRRGKTASARTTRTAIARVLTDYRARSRSGCDIEDNRFESLGVDPPAFFDPARRLRCRQPRLRSAAVALTEPTRVHGGWRSSTRGSLAAPGAKAAWIEPSAPATPCQHIVVPTSDAAVAKATVSGDAVILSGVAEGVATVSVTARDPDGASATQSFSVSVFPFLSSITVSPSADTIAPVEVLWLAAKARDVSGSDEPAPPSAIGFHHCTAAYRESCRTIAGVGRRGRDHARDARGHPSPCCRALPAEQRAR